MSYDGYLSTNSQPPYNFAASHRNLRNRSHPQDREVTSNGFLTLGIISTVLSLHRNNGPCGASVFVTESLIARTYLSESIRERQNVQSHSTRTVLN